MDWVTVVVPTVKICEVVAPPSTVTVLGTVAAALLLESETTRPPVGAADVRVTVPVAELPLVSVLVLIEIPLSAGAGGGGGLTVSVAVSLTFK